MDRIAAKINKLSEESKQSTIREIIQSSESNFILSGMAACNRISSIVFQCFELIRLVIQLVRCCLKINSMPHIRLRALCEIQFCLVLFIYFQTQFGTFFDTCKLPLKKIKTDMALKTLILFLSISIYFYRFSIHSHFSNWTFSSYDAIGHSMAIIGCCMALQILYDCWHWWSQRNYAR